MEARCKKCGKILRDPISVARGMGPICSGASGTGKSLRSRRRAHRGTTYASVGDNYPTTNLFSFRQETQDGVTERFSQFPSDLVDVVLSAPAKGSIATRVKSYSRRKPKQNRVRPGTMLKQIRRMCIELRLLFWPGLSKNFEPIPCIPCCENDWKIGENGRVLSKQELVSYLSRYGIISQTQAQAPMQDLR